MNKLERQREEQGTGRISRAQAQSDAPKALCQHFHKTLGGLLAPEGESITADLPSVH